MEHDIIHVIVLPSVESVFIYGWLLLSMASEGSVMRRGLQLCIAKMQGGLLARALQTWKEWHADEVLIPLCSVAQNALLCCGAACNICLISLGSASELVF